MRAALLFGVWTALCMVLAIAGSFAVFDLFGDPEGFRLRPLDRNSVNIIGFLSAYALPSGAIAGFGWWLLHRKGNQPSWWVYGLFAVAVVIVCNYVIYCATSIGFWGTSIVDMLAMASIILAMYGWVSVPVALIGTALFVVFYRKRLALA